MTNATSKSRDSNHKEPSAGRDDDDDVGNGEAVLEDHGGGGGGELQNNNDPLLRVTVRAEAAAAAAAEPMDPRTRAVREAQATLDSMGGDTHILDGFNLLGVIANPRGGPLVSTASAAQTTAMSASTAYQGGSYASTPTRNNNDNHHHQQHQQIVSQGVLADTYISLEATLSQVTEQLEVLNAILEDWSRQILEDGPGIHGDDYPPESMLTELPSQLRNFDLSSLQVYLESSGVAAHAFKQRHAQLDTKTERALTASISQQEVEQDIPQLFFQSDFDLTNPETFRMLLQGDLTDDILDPKAVAGEDIAAGNVHDWFPLPPQDAFSGMLDKVEIALLQQVRSKSDAFFQESLRFSQLQEWIQGLLQQVVDLQSVTRHLNHALLEPMEKVPISDAQRFDLQCLLDVLDTANELFRCKSSIAGLLAAQDDLSAIDQIQFGRKLLSGDVSLKSTGEENDTGVVESPIELRKLIALKTVSDQLKQYEQLVVTNLRDEIVEIFLEWNTSCASSIYAINGSAATSSAGQSSTTNNPSYRSSHQIQQRVREIYKALRKCRATGQCREAYSKRLQDMIRMTVRTTVGEFATDSMFTGGSMVASISTGATAMSLDRFIDCLDMLFEQLQSLLTSAAGVDALCASENFVFDDDDDENDTLDRSSSQAQRSTELFDKSASGGAASSSSANTNKSSPMANVVGIAAELSCKSVSELLRLRKEAHSAVTLEEMKRIWDKCTAFSLHIEELSGHKAAALRSTLLAQAKAFVENKHERNMSALAAALESERWMQCDVSSIRQETITRLCQGRSVAPSSMASYQSNLVETKCHEVEVEGTRYKVVWSCLLLLEMVISDIAAAIYFPSLSSNLVAKVGELLRLFNSRTTHLVLGAGAIHSNARLKSINAKHLSLVTQCLGLIISIMPHVRAAFMTQMPQKQHTLLTSLDQIKKEYNDHNEKVLNKFVTIIGGIVEHGLAPKIPGTDFDARAKLQVSQKNVDTDTVDCCEFLKGITLNTRKMHQVLAALLPPDHLQDVFSRIFAFVDQKVPALYISFGDSNNDMMMMQPGKPAANAGPKFSFPTTDDGKRRFLLELETTTKTLNGLAGVYAWDFTVVHIFEKYLEYTLHPEPISEAETDNTTDTGTTTETGDGEPPAEESRVVDPNSAGTAANSSFEQASSKASANGGSKEVNGDESKEVVNGSGTT